MCPSHHGVSAPYVGNERGSNSSADAGGVSSRILARCRSSVFIVAGAARSWVSAYNDGISNMLAIVTNSTLRLVALLIRVLASEALPAIVTMTANDTLICPHRLAVSAGITNAIDTQASRTPE